jgi:alpha-tubulin suppressor-like RCC1 family protein
MSMLSQLIALTFAFSANVERRNLLGTGMNQSGECGLGYYIDQNNKVSNIWFTANRIPQGFTSPGLYQDRTPIEDPDQWKTIHGSYQHSVGVKADGSLWTTGYNGFGQLGLNDTTTRYTFTRVGADSDWICAFAGTEHTSALKGDGTIWCWGRNDIAAAIGNGDITPDNVLVPYCVNTTPAPYNQFPNTSRFIDMVAGHRFTLGMDQNYNLWSWGNNGSRQLGRASDSTYVSNPTQDTQIKQIDILGPFTRFSAGAYHAAAVNSAGEMYVWGLNGNGQLGSVAGLGTGGIAPRVLSSPVNGVKWTSVSCG